VQKALSQKMAINVAYVATRQNGITRNRNLNYGQLGGGSASQPFFPLGITSAMNIFAPDGKVVYDSAQVSINRRLSDGVHFTAAYTYSKTIDWWVTPTPIPIPEYWDLNKGETGSPHRLNASLVYELPFGPGKPWLNGDDVLADIAGGWQINSFFSYQSGTLVTVTSNSNVLNAPGTTTSMRDLIRHTPTVDIAAQVGCKARWHLRCHRSARVSSETSVSPRMTCRY
jgi:hypothetical protein